MNCASWRIEASEWQWFQEYNLVQQSPAAGLPSVYRCQLQEVDSDSPVAQAIGLVELRLVDIPVPVAAPQGY